MGDARAYADRVQLKTAVPHGSWSSSGYALASSTRLIAFVPGASVTLDLTALSGTFRSEWWSIDNRTVIAGTNVTGGSAGTVVTSPLGSNAILLLEPTS